MAIPRPVRHLALLFTLAPAIVLQAASAAPRLPDYYPSCPSPQVSAPQHSGGGITSGRNPVVWNGKDYGTVYVGSNDAHLYFRRYFADGTPVGPAVPISTLTGYTSAGFAPGLAWSGSDYLAVWVANKPSDGGYFLVYAIRIAADGTLIGSDFRVSFAVTLPAGSVSSYSPTVAWGVSGYMVAWSDNRNNAATSYDIFATFLNPDGTIANGGAAHDITVSVAPNIQWNPAVAWSQGYNRYVAVWDDSRSGKNELYEGSCSQLGNCFGGILVTTGAGNSTAPSLADNGYGLGVVWSDSRVANNDVFFAQLDYSGYKIGGDLNVSANASASYAPRIIWTGVEYAVIWADNGSGPFRVYFRSIDGNGALLGSSSILTVGGTAGCCLYADAAFGRYGLMVTSSTDYTSTSNLVVPVSCNYVYGPPSCPGNFNAYNITGTSASVTWSPSGDSASDIAYYQVYRNNAAVGKTSGTYYNDGIAPLPPLSLSNTYNYMIQPVNAAQFQNTACTGSIYVRTNSSLTLTLNKSNPDAVLNWTDAGFNNYNIFRGNDPRVMSQIGATPSLTAPDANALNNNLSYFYSVDNPGP